MNNEIVAFKSLEDYKSLDETAYLLKSPRNKTRLLESIEQLKRGRGIEKESVESD